MHEVWLPKSGFVTSQVERDSFAAVLDAARSTKGAFTNEALAQGIATMEKALAEYDVVAGAERGRKERQAEAERIARETPVSTVRIRIIKRLVFKGGHVMQRGEEYTVERRGSTDWDPETGETTAVIAYSYFPGPPNDKGGRSGYHIDAEYAQEI